ARGVAVVNADVDSQTLDDLNTKGIRGLRVNFVTPQSWGVTTVDMLTTLAQKVERLGWHIQIFAHPEQIVELSPVLSTLPVPLVIDHMGRIDPAENETAAAFDVVRRLLDQGNTWVKLSGAYMRSVAGEPDYSDTLALGRALVRQAPERMVWGSDWPHTTQPALSVNDASLLDLFYAWCETEATATLVLVDNPARLYVFTHLAA